MAFNTDINNFYIGNVPTLTVNDNNDYAFCIIDNPSGSNINLFIEKINLATLSMSDKLSANINIEILINPDIPASYNISSQYKNKDILNRANINPKTRLLYNDLLTSSLTSGTQVIKHNLNRSTSEITNVFNELVLGEGDRLGFNIINQDKETYYSTINIEWVENPST